jgi:hypothetical protein
MYLIGKILWKKVVLINLDIGKERKRMKAKE